MPYSSARRVLKELAVLDLLVPDRATNGLLHTYDVMPFFETHSGGVSTLTPPEAVRV